jgi:uncharacterized membrane protein YtjA (UPF0391 family)
MRAATGYFGLFWPASSGTAIASAYRQLPTGRMIIGPSPNAAAAKYRHGYSPEGTMLRWALVFLIIAIIAGVLGLGVVGGTAAWIARVLFVVFIVLFLIGLLTGRRPPVV